MADEVKKKADKDPADYIDHVFEIRTASKDKDDDENTDEG